MRCFLAVPLGGAALELAQQTLLQLQREFAAVRWTRPETMHITLHFFGWIEEERARAALDIVKAVTAATAPFEVTIDRLSSFPERGPPRVLWVGSTAANPSLGALAGEVHDRLASAGFAVDERPFRDHCTLGRARPPWPPESRDAWRRLVTQRLGPATFTADRVVLYESVTGPGGAVYTEWAGLPLDGGNQPRRKP